MVSTVAGASPATDSRTGSLSRELNQTILVLGDSISAAYGIQREQGWVALLQERLKNRGFGARVENASTSGWTTSDGLAQLPRLLDYHRPDIVVLELGGNDGLRGLPLARIRANLLTMVESATARGARVVVVGMEVSPNMGPLYAPPFRAIYREVAAETRAALVPSLFDGFDPTMLQRDGVHPTAEAQPVILDNIWPKLAPMLR